MKRVLCGKLPRAGEAVELSESEANHAIRVLRLRDGDVVEAMDGRGGAVAAVLRVRGAGGTPRLELATGAESRPLSLSSAVLPMHLELAVLKGDAMEWAVEKAVELGVATLIPILTAHSVVQVERKGPDFFRKRWQKIADQALKQCGRLRALEVREPVRLGELDWTQGSGARFWCDESSRGDAPHLLLSLEKAREEARTDGVRLLVGPEGGWSEGERGLLERSRVNRISLGPLVLRAETAAVCAVSVAGAFFLSRDSRS